MFVPVRLCRWAPREGPELSPPPGHQEEAPPRCQQRPEQEPGCVPPTAQGVRSQPRPCHQSRVRSQLRQGPLRPGWAPEYSECQAPVGRHSPAQDPEDLRLKDTRQPVDTKAKVTERLRFPNPEFQAATRKCAQKKLQTTSNKRTKRRVSQEIEATEKRKQ